MSAPGRAAPRNDAEADEPIRLDVHGQCRRRTRGAPVSRVPKLLVALALIVYGPVVYSAVCDVDADGDVDRLDLQSIFDARNQPASGAGDPRDEDANGYITVLDGRACAVRCASSQCEVVSASPLEVNIESPANGALVGSSVIDVSGTVNQPSARVLVSDVIATVASGSFTATGIRLAEGENSLLARANDDRGVIATASRTVTLDTTPPALTILSPPERSTFADAVVSIVATVTDASPVTCRANDAALSVDAGSVTGAVTLASGPNVVVLTCTDAAGNAAQRSLTLYRDDDPLRVAAVDPPNGAVDVSTGAQVTVSFSRPIEPASVKHSGFYLDTGGSILAATLSVAADGLSATLTPIDALPPAAPIDVNVSTSIADPSGLRLALPVESRFTTEGASAEAGTVFGQVFDDRRGLPLTGASVEILSAVDGSVLAAGTTDERGRYLLEPGSGNVLVRVSMPGFTEVTRGVIAASRTLAELFDARITPLAEPELIDNAFGAEIEDSAGNTLSVAPGALSADAEVRLTPISGQGARVPFPLGWTPLGIAQLDAPAAFNPAATLTLALADDFASAIGRDGIIARSADGRWIVQSLVTIDGPTIELAADQTGQYALLVADADADGPAPVTIGGELTAAAAISLDADVTATGSVDPPAGRSDDPTPAAATVQIIGPTLLRSGTVIKGEFMELYSLRDGDEIIPADRSQDLVAYRPLDIADETKLTADFPITPSRQFPLTELLEGAVTVTLAADAPAVSGTLVDAVGGGGVQDPDGSRVIVPGGALSGNVPITLRRFSKSPVNLGNSGLEFVGGLELDLSGAVSSAGLSLSLGGGAGLVPTGATVLIAELRVVKDAERLVLVALARIDGDDLTSVDSADGIDLPGIRASGRYVFLRFDGSLQLVTGTVRDEAGRRDGHVVQVEGLPIVALTDAAGTFVLVSPSGSFSLLATAAEIGDQARVEAETGTPLPEIVIVPTPPRVEAIAVRLPKLEGNYAGPLALLGNPAPLVDDDANGESSGNGNGLIEAGERIELSLSVRNDGTVAMGKGAFALSVSGADDPVRVDSPAIAVETIPPDLPVTVGSFVFTVPAGTDPSRLQYRLSRSTANGLSSAIPFSIPIGVEHPDVRLESEIVVRFSEPVVAGSLQQAMTLAREEGSGPVPVQSHVFASSDGTVATLRPLAALADNARYQLSLTAGIVDADGRALADAPIVERLSTEDRTPPPAVDPGQIEASVPDADGLVRVTGTTGSVNPDDTVILLNETTGLTRLATVGADGSFSASILAEVSDQLTLIIRDRNGNELSIDPGPWVRRDPATGEVLSAVIGRAGGEFASADGVRLIIPAGALSSATEVSVARVQDAFELPADLASDPDLVAAFEGLFRVAERIRITADAGVFTDPIKLSMPARQGAAIGDLYLVVRSRQVRIGGPLADLDQLTGLTAAENPVRNVQRLEVIESATVKSEAGLLVLSTDSPPFPGITEPGLLTLLRVDGPLLFLAGEVRRNSEDGQAVSGAVVRSMPSAEATAPYVVVTDAEGQFVVADANAIGQYETGDFVGSRLDVDDPKFQRVIRRDVRGMVSPPAPSGTAIAHLEEPFVLPAPLPPVFEDILGDVEPPSVEIAIEGPSFSDGFSRVGDPLTVTINATDDDEVEFVGLSVDEGDGFQSLPLTSQGVAELVPAVETVITLRARARDRSGNETFADARVRTIVAAFDFPLVPEPIAGVPEVLDLPSAGETPSFGGEATLIPYDAYLCVQFSEPMAPNSITDQTFRVLDPEGTMVPVSFTFDANDSHVCAAPMRYLRLGASYSVHLSSSIEDSQGERLSGTTLYFVTLAPAQVFEKQRANVEDIALAGDAIVAVSHPTGASAGDNGTLHVWRMGTDEAGQFKEIDAAEVPVRGRPVGLAVQGGKAYVSNRFLGPIAIEQPILLPYLPAIGATSPSGDDDLIILNCSPDSLSPADPYGLFSPCWALTFLTTSFPDPPTNLQVFDLSDPMDPRSLGAVPTNNLPPNVWAPNNFPRRVEITNDRVAIASSDNIEYFTTYPGNEPITVSARPESLGVLGWVPDYAQFVGRCEGGTRDDQICVYDPLPGTSESFLGVACEGGSCNWGPTRFIDAVFFDEFAVSLDSDGLRILSAGPDDLNEFMWTGLGSKIQTLAFVEGLTGTSLGAVPKFEWGRPGGTDLLFVASKSDGLTVLDVSIPSAPQELGHLPGKFGTMSFDAYRGLAYLHGPQGQFHVVDFNDPNNLLELNDPGNDGDVFSMEGFGGRSSFNGNTNRDGFVYVVGPAGVGVVRIPGCDNSYDIAPSACPPRLVPSAAAVSTNGTLKFSVLNGEPPYEFTIVAGPSSAAIREGDDIGSFDSKKVLNPHSESFGADSGPTIDENGLLKAGTIPGTYLVRMTDSGRNPNESADATATVVKLKLTEVWFDNDHPILKDQVGKEPLLVSDPVWLDTDADGVGEKQDAVSYMIRERMKVRARFKVEPSPGSDVSGLKVRGEGSSSIDFEDNEVSILQGDNGYVFTSWMTSDDRLPSEVHQETMEFKWSFSSDGVNFSPAGHSSHKVYVTLKKPLGSAGTLQTALHYATKIPGAKTPAEAVLNTWQMFEGPANIHTWEGEPLSYYPAGRGFSALCTRSGKEPCPSNSVDLLTTGAGPCGSFSSLLRASFAANGIDSAIYRVSSKNEDEQMVVKEWDFGTPSLCNENQCDSEDFIWKLTLQVWQSRGSCSMVPSPPSDIYEDLKSIEGIPGQGAKQPSEKIFKDHYIVRAINPGVIGVSFPHAGDPWNQYLDPSYGVTYKNERDFESKALAGYARRTDANRCIFGVRRSIGRDFIRFERQD